MKKNNRGFTLVETLVVSSFIVGILVFLFAQFSKLKKSYDASFEYLSSSAETISNRLGAIHATKSSISNLP